MVNSSDDKASGGTFQLHPLGAAFAVYTTPGAVDPLVAPMKKRVGMTVGTWNTAVRRPTRGHHRCSARDVTRKPMSRLPSEAPQQPSRTR